MNARRWTAPLFAALALFASACRGPDPIVERQTLEPFDRGTKVFRVEAVIVNRSGGDGQIEVEATLVRRRDGEVVARADREVELHAGERQTVVVELPRPPSAAELTADALELRVEAHYPID